MAANSGRAERCKYCNSYGAHHQGCPSIDAATIVADWEEGFQRGFDDEYIPHVWYYHSHSFAAGFQAGKSEIEALVEQAVEDNHHYGYGPM